MNSKTCFWLFSILIQSHVSLVGGQAEQVEKQAESCRGETLSLSCSEEYAIKVKKIELGDTECYMLLTSLTCCPKPSDCTAPPSESHKNFVLERCNAKRSCTITAVSEHIRCNGNSEFERITYSCVERTSTTPTSSLLQSSTSSTTVSSAVSSSTKVDSLFTKIGPEVSPNRNIYPAASEDNTTLRCSVDLHIILLGVFLGVSICVNIASIRYAIILHKAVGEKPQTKPATSQQPVYTDLNMSDVSHPRPPVYDALTPIYEEANNISQKNQQSTGYVIFPVDQTATAENVQYDYVHCS